MNDSQGEVNAGGTESALPLEMDRERERESGVKKKKNEYILWRKIGVNK